jgi:hypothetical protein
MMINYLRPNIRFLFKFILPIFLLSSYQPAFAQTTAIPDSIFERELINLGIDSDTIANGQILNSDAAGVVSLILTQVGVRSLEGIDAFVNLDTLVIVREPFLDSCVLTNNSSLTYVFIYENDQLTHLDLSNNLSLTYLECHYNDSLNELNISNNTGLTYLYISNNSISSIDVSSSLGLLELWCDHNFILSNLDVSNNTALTKLNAAHNGMTNLDVSNNVALTYLNCSGNSLSNLDVSNNIGLTNLLVGLCNLTNLDVSNNIALTYLNCSENSLFSLDVSNNTGLTFLAAILCNLHSLDVSNNINLVELFCRQNELSTLDVSNNLSLVELWCEDNQLTDLDLGNHTNLDRLWCQENQLSRLVLPGTNLMAMNCFANSQYLQICVPDSTAAANEFNWYKDFLAKYTENCALRAVEGRVTIDLNVNCIADSIESGVINQLIKFESNSRTLYFSTIDTNGNYIAYLDTGVYKASLVPSNAYWQGCPSIQTIYVDTNYVLQTVDWSLQAVVHCPLLTVDISAPFLRMTGGGSAYTISYCNEGTEPAINAYVEVELDSFLNVINSNLPIVSQNGTTYTFNIGNVAVGACGAFNLQVLVDTSALVAQTHCSEARIYPDSICLPSLWAGADINVIGQCVNDSIIFTIQNVGNNMVQPLNYFIVEDNIMMRQGNFNLGGLGSTQVTQYANAGSTYRIWAEQENGYPLVLGNPFTTAFVEGCVLDSLGGFNTGFVLQYDNDNSAPFISVDCQENIASYDPNDKGTQPKGYDVQHYIYDYTPLDYKIRFQNIGNDTAFIVVIRDTISPHLDPAKLVMGASSHSYTWSLSEQGILEVRFENIRLVDSLTNELLSHGFFNYKIQQKENNPIGTIINNTAAIYFDYNPPIFTNTTYHTVGEDFIVVHLAIGKLYEEEIAVKVFPNPFTHSTTIQVEGEAYESLKLSVFDVAGRLVAEESSVFTNSIELQNSNFGAGIYIYRLEGDGRLINTGKLIAQ